MSLFARIHEIIVKRLEHHADAGTVVDTQALTQEVIAGHAVHQAEPEDAPAETVDVDPENQAPSDIDPNNPPVTQTAQPIDPAV